MTILVRNSQPAWVGDFGVLHVKSATETQVGLYTVSADPINGQIVLSFSRLLNEEWRVTPNQAMRLAKLLLEAIEITDELQENLDDYEKIVAAAARTRITEEDLMDPTLPFDEENEE